jgi:hypothetical protein
MVITGAVDAGICTVAVRAIIARVSVIDGRTCSRSITLIIGTDIAVIGTGYTGRSRTIFSSLVTCVTLCFRQAGIGSRITVI